MRHTLPHTTGVALAEFYRRALRDTMLMKNDHTWAKWAASAAGTAPKLGDLHRDDNRINVFRESGYVATETAAAAKEAVAPDFRSRLTMEADGDVLRVRGDIDLHVAPVFRQRAQEHICAADSPQLDLREVPFLDSAGLAALLALSREAKNSGKDLRLAACGSPRRVLRITGIDRMLRIED